MFLFIKSLKESYSWGQFYFFSLLCKISSEKKGQNMGHVVFFYHMNLHVPLRMRAKIDYKRGRLQSLYPGADIGVNLGAMSQPWKNSLLFPRERF